MIYYGYRRQVDLIIFKYEYYTLFAMRKYTPTGIRSVDKPRKRRDKHSRIRNKPTLLLMIMMTLIQICLKNRWLFKTAIHSVHRSLVYGKLSTWLEQPSLCLCVLRSEIIQIDTPSWGLVSSLRGWKCKETGERGAGNSQGDCRAVVLLMLN